MRLVVLVLARLQRPGDGASDDAGDEGQSAPPGHGVSLRATHGLQAELAPGQEGGDRHGGRDPAPHQLARRGGSATNSIRLRQSLYWRAHHAGAGAYLVGADLAGDNLAGVVLPGANLRRAHLAGADLEGANLVEADLRAADLTRVNLRGARLQGADLQAADLRSTLLGGANPTVADLAHADLEGTDLRGADLRGAALTAADLGHTDLRGVNLRGAHLSGVRLAGACYDRLTRWPLRFDPARHGARRVH
jgi:hypothetical protein